MKSLLIIPVLMLAACSTAPTDPCNDPGMNCKYKAVAYKPLQADHAVTTDDGRVLLKANWKDVRDAELTAPLRRTYGVWGR